VVKVVKLLQIQTDYTLKKTTMDKNVANLVKE
jgi:hypothetical protein